MTEATGVEEAEVYLKHSAKGPGNRLGAQPLHEQDLIAFRAHPDGMCVQN
ncbi:MAG: hypothetical protein ABNH38_05005 [Tateyamaria sp.]|jgi:hypothetical protein